jgi:hypothetical protein
MPLPRGRPPKYGKPSRIVAVTLPEEVVETLGKLHGDLGWAIVTLAAEHKRRAGSRRGPAAKPSKRASAAEAALVSVGSGQSLIVVNTSTVRSLPGVQMIPISETQALLALEPGKGMADLELAVLDRLERLSPRSPERRAISELLTKLRKWRHDDTLSFHSRSIILVARQRG